MRYLAIGIFKYRSGMRLPDLLSMIFYIIFDKKNYQCFGFPKNHFESSFYIFFKYFTEDKSSRKYEKICQIIQTLFYSIESCEQIQTL